MLRGDAGRGLRLWGQARGQVSGRPAAVLGSAAGAGTLPQPLHAPSSSCCAVWVNGGGMLLLLFGRKLWEHGKAVKVGQFHAIVGRLGKGLWIAWRRRMLHGLSELGTRRRAPTTLCCAFPCTPSICCTLRRPRPGGGEWQARRRTHSCDHGCRVAPRTGSSVWRPPSSSVGALHYLVATRCLVATCMLLPRALLHHTYVLLSRGQ